MVLSPQNKITLINQCNNFLYDIKEDYEMIKNDLKNHDWKYCLSERKPIGDS